MLRDAPRALPSFRRMKASRRLATRHQCREAASARLSGRRSAPLQSVVEGTTSRQEHPYFPRGEARDCSTERECGKETSDDI